MRMAIWRIYTVNQRGVWRPWPCFRSSLTLQMLLCSEVLLGKLDQRASFLYEIIHVLFSMHADIKSIANRHVVSSERGLKVVDVDQQGELRILW